MINKCQKDCIANITEKLSNKAVLKQDIHKITKGVFKQFQDILENFALNIDKNLAARKDIIIEYTEKNAFESQIIFSGDALTFTMHTNVFNFDSDYFIHELPYVKENPDRAYCGVIEIYNFLADSFRYSRYDDLGYLIARVFINKEQHFFVEGERQLGFLYHDFEHLIINEEFISLIIEKAMLFSIDFDLWAPKYQDVKELSVGQKIKQQVALNHRTGKRIGFDTLSVLESKQKAEK